MCTDFGMEAKYEEWGDVALMPGAYELRNATTMPVLMGHRESLLVSKVPVGALK